MKGLKVTTIFFVCFLSIFFTSCISMEDIVMESAADMLSSEGSAASVFTQDNDPELIADALPLALKLYELVLASNKEHSAIHYATGKNFIMYANAFIQTPAGMLADEDFLKQEAMLKRAKNMYLRGRDYILEGINLRHDGFLEAIEKGMLDEAFMLIKKPEEAAELYWLASGWIAAYSCDPFDFELANTLYLPSAMLLRALELNESLNSGAIHDVFIQIYSSLPYSHISKAIDNAPLTIGNFYNTYYNEKVPSLTNMDKTDYHFNRSLELSKRQNPGTFCSYASSVCVKEQDYKTYKKLLEEAVSIDSRKDPDNELVTIIFQQKAEWMLEHAEDFFISIEEN